MTPLALAGVVPMEVPVPLEALEPIEDPPDPPPPQLVRNIVSAAIPSVLMRVSFWRGVMLEIPNFVICRSGLKFLIHESSAMVNPDGAPRSLSALGYRAVGFARQSGCCRPLRLKTGDRCDRRFNRIRICTFDSDGPDP
jgi:hypothetical protein